MKYPIELELSSFCTLKCKSCINKDLEEKYFMKEEDFYKITDFLYKNIDELLCIDLAGLGDTFTHPDITKFLEHIYDKFRGTGLSLNFSQKGQLIKEEHLEIFEKMKDEGGFDLNFYVGIFSIRKNVYKFLSGGDSINRVIDFAKDLKRRGFNVSIELLNNYFSSQEYERFFELCEVLGCNSAIKNITNYGGSISDYSGYLFGGYNNVAEEKESMIFTEEKGAGLDYLEAKCQNLPYFRADSKITMCSNLHGFSDSGIMGDISEIDTFSSLGEIYRISQKEVFSKVCEKCSLNEGNEKFCSEDYYIDPEGKIIRDPALVKIYDIDSYQDLYFLYTEDKDFIHEIVTNPEHIHKHEKIDFLQILDLIDKVKELDFIDFFKYLISFWKQEHIQTSFQKRFNKENIKNAFGEISKFCKENDIEPLDFYFFAYAENLLSQEEYIKKILLFKKYAIESQNATNLAYLQIIQDKVLYGRLDEDYSESILKKYYGIFQKNDNKKT